jgi:hypothetical protein
MTLGKTSRTAAVAMLLLPGAVPAFAQGGDVTIFGGYTYPTYQQTFRTSLPPLVALPDVVLTPDGDFTLDASGGPVFGVAGAFELGGFFAIEGRFDSSSIKLKSSGVRYVLDAGDITGSISLAEGPIEVDRLNLLSLNLRLRTPGVVTFYVSGGLSYLPSFAVTGSLPITVDISGINLPPREVPVKFEVAPTESSFRFGVNGGAGIRFPIAPHVSLVGDARVFYFREYELQAVVPQAPGVPDLDRLGLIQFTPVVVNAVGGVAIRF